MLFAEHSRGAVEMDQLGFMIPIHHPLLDFPRDLILIIFLHVLP
jgi:hypothetical protein